MATSKDEIKNLYPLPAYNFKVSIGSESYSFSQVSGLTMQYDTITYKHGLSASEGAEYLLGMLQPINITLQKGIVNQGSILLEWISNVRMRKVIKQDLTIDLCDENGEPVVTWNVLNAFPTTLEAPTFDVNTNDVAIETITLMASGIRVTYHTIDQTGGTTGSGYI